MNSNNSSPSSEPLQEPNSPSTKIDGSPTSKGYSLTEEQVNHIDSLDLNPAQRAKRIQTLLIAQDSYDVLCFCIYAIPGLIVQAPPFIHALAKKLAAYVHQYHYFIRNEDKLK